MRKEASLFHGGTSIGRKMVRGLHAANRSSLNSPCNLPPTTADLAGYHILYITNPLHQLLHGPLALLGLFDPRRPLAPLAELLSLRRRHRPPHHPGSRSQ